jgi:hypothetical protein
MERVARRLPGVYVDVTPPEAVETLPRMDIAVFVGFAATGPLHLPVLIESVAQYAAVFGPDAPLAWDDVRGERVYVYLGPAVRAFFANGGRRCWVTRVARSLSSEAVRLGVKPAELAETDGIASVNVFAIPGVLEVVADRRASPAPPPIQAALAEACCEGSWSDDLRVSVAVQKQAFGVADFGPGASPASRRIAFRSRAALRDGDLIEWNDGTGGGLTAYAIIEHVQPSLHHGGPAMVEATVCAAFDRAAPESPPASPSTQEGEAFVRGFSAPVPATLASPVDVASPATLTFHAPVAASLERGHWARWSDGGTTVWLRIDSIERKPAFAGSPMVMSSGLVEATVTGPAWREVEPELAAAIGTMRHALLLTLELRVVDGIQPFRLAPVGLTPRHAAAWWNHVNDSQYYGLQDDTSAGLLAPVVTAETRRFPLSRAQEPNPLAWLPLGVEPIFGPALAPLPQRATALERDGLATFNADLFLDPELAAVPVQDLAELADSIRFLRDPTRRLLGIHGAFSIGRGGVFNEATLLAVPDAIHLGWEPRLHPAVAPAQPADAPTPPQWRTHRGACAPAESTPAEGPDFGVFLDCTTSVLDTPVLYGPDAAVPPGAYRLTWSEIQSAQYVLVEATQPDLSDALEIYRGPDTEHVAFTTREGVYYYRVFAERGDERSAGSNPVAVQVRRDEWVQSPVAIADATMASEWLAVHRAALRLAAANGDLFVALAMPRHFRTPQALQYAERLRAVRQPPLHGDADALDFREGRALSYGALYFPWLQADLSGTPQDRADGTALAATKTRAPRVVPPDGAVTGVLAARASLRGAWVAPANELMKDVVALAPVVGESEWAAVQDAQINLVRFDPRGLFTLSADTLALEPDVRPINVRRLMILLRRLALRRGANYVFEPNGPELRRAVEHSFGELLTDLFRRGAFAGVTPSQSFRVVTDDTINRPADDEAGRFFVELRIAPSVPMRFLALRLRQQGERLSVMEEL